MPAWVNTTVDSYTSRLQPPWDIKLHEITAQKRTKKANLSTTIQYESQQLWQARPPNSFTIILERTGLTWSSNQFADQLAQKLSLGIGVNFIIGGPEGIDPSYFAQADALLSLSALTFPHPLVRVMLAEQIYRAWSINSHHPYHR